MRGEFDFHIIEEPSIGRNSNSSRSFFDSRKDLLYIAEDLDGDSLSNATTHEFSHFLLHAGSPYGSFVDSVNWCEQRLLFDCVGRFKNANISVPSPFYEFANRVFKGRWSFFSSATKRFAEAAVRDYIQPWSVLSHIENVMESRNLASVRRETEASAFSYLLRAEGIITQNMGMAVGEEAIHPDQALINCFHDNDSACPEVQVLGHGTDRIGATHIFESMAVLAEKDHLAVMSIRTQPEYGFLYFTHYLAPTIAEYAQGRPIVLPDGNLKIRNDISSERFELFARAFAAVCDLALFSPIGPVYAPLRKKFPERALLWMQMHPGWRVLQGLRDIQTLAPFMEDLSTGLGRLQSHLCKENFWIEPQNFYDAALSFTTQSNIENMQRHLAFMSLRASHPLLLFKLHLQEEATTTERLAMEKCFLENMPWVHMPNSGFAIRDRDDLLRRIVTYFMSSSSDQLMFKKKLDAITCIPASIDYGRYFSNMKNASEFAGLLRSSLYGPIK
ncbi:hypothetical protein [Rhizobium leguminosarum]|uniref:hypothetical protein n=1 Tax=Rhizobium leguminosarum TaxID=384 RepID=UPI001C98AC28|nr:hypothetical protein [Rhizobium leguminosarum]MBY5524445.1 hypothetical protein [Rhizobium leguminosarum]